MTGMRGTLGCLLAGTLIAGLAACGGDKITPPPPSPTPPPAPKVVAQGGQGIEVGYAYGLYFDVDATGTLDVTVDYTFADSLLFFWLAKGRCTGDQFEADQCNYVATSFAGGKPRKLSASGQTAGTYTLIVGNLGPKDESISYMVVFTQTAAGGSVGASARGAAEPGFLAPLPAHARQR